MNISKSTTISSLTKSNPMTMDVFSRFGCQISGDSESTDQTIEQLCLEHALDYDEVVTELYKTLE